MTDLQDLLLDKMVGAKAGRLWGDGPFHAAALLVPGKVIAFKDAYGGSAARNAVSARLGYPRMLLEGAHGALSALATEDDRRALAMGVILAVPPGKKQKPRPSAAYRVAAVAATRQAHALACSVAGCGLLAALDAALSAGEKTGGIGHGPRVHGCPPHESEMARAANLSPKSTALSRSLHAAENAALSFSYRQPAEKVNACAREACRAAAMVGGVSGAVALCAELARRLGMEAKA